MKFLSLHLLLLILLENSFVYFKFILKGLKKLVKSKQKKSLDYLSFLGKVTDLFWGTQFANVSQEKFYYSVNRF